MSGQGKRSREGLAKITEGINGKDRNSRCDDYYEEAGRIEGILPGVNGQEISKDEWGRSVAANSGDI